MERDVHWSAYVFYGLHDQAFNGNISFTIEGDHHHFEHPRNSKKEPISASLKYPLLLFCTLTVVTHFCW